MTKLKEKLVRVGLPTWDDMNLAEQLLQEVGGVPTLHFYLDTFSPAELNPLVPNYSAGVREMIRCAALEKHGFDRRKWYPIKEHGEFFHGFVIGRGPDNKIIFKGKLDDSPDKKHVRALLSETIHRCYEWDDVVYWNLGLFNTFKTAPNGFLVFVKAGVFLFKDEVEKLNSGKTVTPEYWGGLNDWGIVEDRLDTYQVRNGQLFRVWAHLLD